MGLPSVPKQVVTSGTRAVSSDSSSFSYSSGNTATSLGTARTHCSTVPEQPPEEWALVQLAHRLGSVAQGEDVKANDEELREARLLMSLSCAATSDAEAGGALAPQQQQQQQQPSSSHHHHHDYSASDSAAQDMSGRITPQSLESSQSGGSANRGRRDAFRFTCPSLSLDGSTTCSDASSLEAQQQQGGTSAPALMLGRTLKVDDVDALRLSSDAMARNVLMSFQKSMEWRMQSWVESLSQALLQKEQDLQEEFLNSPQEKEHQERLWKGTQSLLTSDEALLVAALRESQDKIEAQQASTSFKVLQRVTNASSSASGVVSIDPSTSDCDGIMKEWMASGRLQEGEYLYDVTHNLEMQSTLSINTPAGYVKIDVSVPGTIKGLFLSAAECDDGEELTNVKVSLNTTMLAGMIDKGSRIAVRSSVEALLSCDHVVEKSPSSNDADKAAMMVQNLKSPAKTTVTAATATTTTSTPKRGAAKEDRPVSGLVVVTPRDASSPSTFADSSSDSEDSSNAGKGKSQPVPPHIPDSFKRSGKVLFPQPTRFPPMKKCRTSPPVNGDSSKAPASTGTPVAHASMITPLKANNDASRMSFHKQTGPNFPLLADSPAVEGEQ
eukprot:CAMPEP_0113520490 /NCGR_PEP_ID=MMETSP0014_2-20120614/44113_1 /TAXON_ID=2857 /ORGANISM="Nitzschia sp." /LENGTH=610 /DNA_ID=CAMNT_0000418343 /DNA_START=119 /DNA_END=1951 /DNA_ORIENTATION=- /assembly_acc=CAM_ASM_000159